METYVEVLAEIDKQKRLKSLTNRDLAKKVGLAESTVNGFMGGKRYSETVKEKLCGALGIEE
ncbi:MAG: helix-turn-helix transcriptional regulator [Bacteroides sp.]|nr:helix-turn-helix transcriptional regulator [Bacteroides sp.]